MKIFLESNNFSFMEINPLQISRVVRGKLLKNNEDRYSERAIHSPRPNDSRALTLPTVILSHGSAKVANEISGSFGPAAFRIACGAYQYSGKGVPGI